MRENYIGSNGVIHTGEPTGNVVGYKIVEKITRQIQGVLVKIPENLRP